MQTDTKTLIQTITEAIQDKKGQNIVIADFSKIDNVIYKYFIICQGNSANQVDAITREIGDAVREKLGEKPLSLCGEDNCIWVALDYSEVIVHIFQPEARVFYDLEHLWEDAKLTEIPNLD